ncbi:RNA-binding ATPase activator esf2 [Batrachochytrium dendrobatidis]
MGLKDNDLGDKNSSIDERTQSKADFKRSVKVAVQSDSQSTKPTFAVDSRFILTSECQDDENNSHGKSNESNDEETDDEGSVDQGETDDEEEEEANDAETDAIQLIKQSQTAKPLTLDSLKKFQDKINRTGVVYLSRIPPFMKATKMRSLLARYGQIGRIFLNPEDAKVAARRRKYKHNKRQNFKEGWIEFLDKDQAKRTAATLNNTIIGGKKRSRFYDDIWNIKYLPRFKWNHLTEQLAYELKVKEQRVQTEMAQAKRENKVYLKNVSKAKMIQAMEAKKSLKRDREANDDETKASQASSAIVASQPATHPIPDTPLVRRSFKQRKVIDSHPVSTSKPSTSTKKQSLFSKIF